MRRYGAILVGLAWCWASQAVLGTAGEIKLTAADAGISGGAEYYADGDFIGAWHDQGARLQWEVLISEETTARVELDHSCAPGCGGKLQIEVDNQRLTGETRSTGGWHTYKVMDLGEVKLSPGRHVVTLRAGPFQTAPMNVRFIRLAPADGAAKTFLPPRPEILPPAVYVVPNFHPASCGWLTNWATERNYCANSYLNHLDRVRDDPGYAFVMSECNNMIAIASFLPERFEELKQRVKEGRVELVNGFFLEPTINLSGGEALAKMGIEGLRWQEQVMGVRPRFCWAIDVCGTHAQMPQLCAGLGLEALIYTRCNPAGKAVFWSESPDGTRLLTIVPGHYSEDFATVFSRREPVRSKQLIDAERMLAGRMKVFPDGAPVLILGGHGDYALAPADRRNPAEFLQAWKSFQPRTEVRFATFGNYVDALLPSIRAEKVELPTVRGGTRFTFDSFWIECPKVKTWYRRDEHALQAAETLATVASLQAGYDYPAQDFYHGWLQMLLNMDRNTLWGAAGGMVFEHPTSWDVQDRFQWVESHSQAVLAAAAQKLLGEGHAVGLFNPASFSRTDVLRLKLPHGKRPADSVCQDLGDGTALCRLELPPASVTGIELRDERPAAPRTTDLPATIETSYYSARIEPATGALASLKAKPSGRELLSGPANAIVAEEHIAAGGDPGDFTAPRSRRPRRGSTSDQRPTLRVSQGPLATTVEAEGPFCGGNARRITRFYKDHPRIDFETDLNDIPDRTVVLTEFPLAEEPTEVRRGIPFGFALEASSPANPQLPETAQGIEPAVRFSHYTLPSGGGVTLLDRGLTGRELNGKVPVIYLYNATDTYYGYPNPWLSGKGDHHFEYAIVPHAGDWNTAAAVRRAWEYNCPVSLIAHCAPSPARSFLSTSDNLIAEVARREGNEIEIRLEECLGQAGEGRVTVPLPHDQAAITDLTGGHRQPLAGGPTYTFPVRPQQIITLRLRTATAVRPIEPLLNWEPLVPPAKRATLHEYMKNVIGHPPRGS